MVWMGVALCLGSAVVGPSSVPLERAASDSDEQPGIFMSTETLSWAGCCSLRAPTPVPPVLVLTATRDASTSSVG